MFFRTTLLIQLKLRSQFRDTVSEFPVAPHRASTTGNATGPFSAGSQSRSWHCSRHNARGVAKRVQGLVPDCRYLEIIGLLGKDLLE